MNDIPIEIILKTNIRKMRTDLGWSQEKLAEKIDVSPSHITQIENGNRSPSIDVIAKIANAFGVEYKDLFSTDTENLAKNNIYAIRILKSRVISAVNKAIEKEFDS